jgi:hypothetical protein
MLCRETMVEIHTLQRNIFRGYHVKILNIKPGYVYSSHWPLTLADSGE